MAPVPMKKAYVPLDVELADTDQDEQQQAEAGLLLGSPTMLPPNPPQPTPPPHIYTCHLATAAGGFAALLLLVIVVSAGPLHPSAPSSTTSSSGVGTVSPSAAAAAAGGGRGEGGGLVDPSSHYLDPQHQPTTGAGSSQQQQQQQQRRGYVYVPPGPDAVPCKGPELRCGLVNPQPVPDFDFRNKSRLASGRHGMVSADSSRCSDIGTAILADGGNAVDAAVATTLCQGVVNPVASGIGGGAFIMIRAANGSAEFINARETAPAAANATMYAGKGAFASIDGGLSVAVPLELKGLHLAWSRWGTLPWSRLVTPAEQLAREGFGAHPYLVYAMTGPFSLQRLQSRPLLREAFLIRNATGGWRAPYVGELCCRRPALANTLKRVAQEGPGFLYQPPAAAALAAEVAAEGGILTAEDLTGADVEVTQPLTVQLGGYDLVLPPPPSSAAVVAFCLKFLAGYGTTALGPLPANSSSSTPSSGAAAGAPGGGTAADSSSSGGERMSFGTHSEKDGGLGLQRLVECMKHGFAVRTALGDPGTPSAPSPHAASIQAATKDLLSDAFVTQMRGVTSDTGVLDSKVYGGRWNPQGWVPPEEHGTSHLNVVDKWRNAVSITSTVNIPFGSGIVSASTGILLNDEMDDFAQPNKSSSVTPHAAEANFIAPGRRPLSAMSPMFAVERGTGRLVAAVGASGGPLIVSATLQTLTRLLLEGTPVQDAVGSPRVHDQLLPSQDAMYEAYTWGYTQHELPEPVVAALQHRGQHPVPQAFGLGVSQAIVVDYSPGPEGQQEAAAAAAQGVGAGSSSSQPAGVLRGMSDARKDGAASGY